MPYLHRQTGDLGQLQGTCKIYRWYHDCVAKNFTEPRDEYEQNALGNSCTECKVPSKASQKQILVLHNACVHILRIVSIVLQVVVQCSLSGAVLHHSTSCDITFRTTRMWTQHLCKTSLHHERSHPTLALIYVHLSTAALATLSTQSTEGKASSS